MLLQKRKYWPKKPSLLPPAENPQHALIAVEIAAGLAARGIKG